MYTIPQKAARTCVPRSTGAPCPPSIAITHNPDEAADADASPAKEQYAHTCPSQRPAAREWWRRLRCAEQEGSAHPHTTALTMQSGDNIDPSCHAIANDNNTYMAETATECGTNMGVKRRAE